MTLYICFRKNMRELLLDAHKYFEVIVWSSSQEDYTRPVVAELEKQLYPFRFDHVLTSEDRSPTTNKDLLVKNLDILTGVAGRR
mmetsp:Transcript_30490/g.46730  ORF Transcript_30490/g.46730 Transcript_30490/m.46730 type:complete len:84 (+) Transcript_30490:1162-1413(+)